MIVGPPRTKLRLFAALFAVVALSAACRGDGAGPAEPSPGADDGYRGTVLTDPLPRPSFTLVDTSGSFYDLAAETNGYLTLLFFGYTHCADVCPGHMANIAAVLKRLPDDVARRVKVVFVTVDPERDTPQLLREWLDLFDPSFVGLTGDPKSIDSAMKKTLGDIYFPVTRVDSANGDYSVSHAAFVLAYTSDDLAHTVYPFGTQQGDWEHDLRKLAAGGWAQVASAPVPSQPPPAAAGAPSARPVEAPAPSSPPGHPRRLGPAEARKLLGAEPAALSIEEVRAAVDRAFQVHPDAARFISQGLPVSRDQLGLEIRICGSGPAKPADSSLLACSTLGGCARLTRILYDYYVQSGYEEFYWAAAAVYNYVRTALPAEAEAFTLVVRSELRVTGLPVN